MTLAQTERAALADLFLEVGPDQPTLCAGWTTSDLVTHLLIREHRPDAAISMVIPQVKPWNDRVAAGYNSTPFADRVATYRRGPGVFNPMSWSKIDAVANGAEMFIHHEDVRRGRPGWTSRELDPATLSEVVKLLSSPLTTMAFKRAKVGAVARLTDEPDQRDRPIVLHRGQTTAVLRGGAAEILLWASGRDAVNLEFDGDPDAIAALKSVKR